MAQLAIQGHATRGKEVIEILEMFGGKIRLNRYAGNELFCGYYINESGYIDFKHYSLFDDITSFTLEEFLKKFPYKVGDKVIDIKTNKIVEIYKVHWSESNDCTYYDVKFLNDTGCVRSYKFLQPYKEKEIIETKPNLV